jgi:hypothetical protein
MAMRSTQKHIRKFFRKFFHKFFHKGRRSRDISRNQGRSIPADELLRNMAKNAEFTAVMAIGVKLTVGATTGQTAGG